MSTLFKSLSMLISRYSIRLFQDGKKVEFSTKEFRDLGGNLMSGLAIQLEHEIKYQQSFEFNFTKNSTNKEFMNSPFVKFLTELRQNKSLLSVGA